MKTQPRQLSLICSVGLALLVGCATSGIANRAKEKSAMMAGLDPQNRQHVESGYVEITYTPDMVYVALGKPSRIDHKPSVDGDIEIWIYRNIALPGGEGFRGLRYDSNFDITPGPITKIFERPVYDQQQGSKSTVSGNGRGFGINLTALDSATSIADLPMGTLYVFFYNGRVFKMVLGD